MSGIDRIIDKIISQANIQAENETNYVLSKIEKSEKEQKKRFDRSMEGEIAHAKKRASEEYKRVIADAMLECRKNLLNEKVQVINEVFDKTLIHLTKLPETSYINMLANMAKMVLVEGENEIILNTNDNKNIGAKLVKTLKENNKEYNISLSNKTIKSSGGLIVKNGDIQTNLTFEAVLRVEREKLEGEVVKLLFEGS